MNLQEKLDKVKYQLTSLETISEEIRKDGYTIEGREKIMATLERHPIFESSWDGLGLLYQAMDEIYKQHDPEFSLPRFQNDCYSIDWVYTQDYGYLLLKFSTSRHYPLALAGFKRLFDEHKKNTKEHTPETTYDFVMNCVNSILLAARKMLTLPIFDANELIFLSLMQHYYVDYNIQACPHLDYIIDKGILSDHLGNDFKRMIFETNGDDPLSVRGSLPVISHYARKKALGYDYDIDSSHLVKDMRSNKALNLRKAFGKMELYLGNRVASLNKRIDFACTVGVEPEPRDYPELKRMYGVSDKPSSFYSNTLRLGLFDSCRNPSSSSFCDTYVGWIDFVGDGSVYDRFEDLFNCLEDDVINTLEDNYNFLLEKLPVLEKKSLRNTMLEYIMEGF